MFTTLDNIGSQRWVKNGGYRICAALKLSEANALGVSEFRIHHFSAREDGCQAGEQRIHSILRRKKVRTNLGSGYSQLLAGQDTSGYVPEYKDGDHFARMALQDLRMTISYGSASCDTGGPFEGTATALPHARDSSSGYGANTARLCLSTALFLVK